MAAPISSLTFSRWLAIVFGNYAKPIIQGLIAVQTYGGFGSI
jgi:hypothetical protein